MCLYIIYQSSVNEENSFWTGMGLKEQKSRVLIENLWSREIYFYAGAFFCFTENTSFVDKIKYQYKKMAHRWPQNFAQYDT